MTVLKKIKNVVQLLRALRDLANWYRVRGELGKYVETTALLYLVSELCPGDRSTEHITTKIRKLSEANSEK